MKRITAGAYGICEKTGKRIPKQRLRAVPWTRFTKEAEEALEREGGFRRIGLAEVASVQGPGPGGLAQAEEPEKEEPHARVIGRHQLAKSLKTLEEGAQQKPEPEEASPPYRDGTAGNTRRRLARRAPARPMPGKSSRAAAARGRRQTKAS